jgi:hypothetical protein
MSISIVVGDTETIIYSGEKFDAIAELGDAPRSKKLNDCDGS